MNLGIEVKQLLDGGGYVANVDWSKGDAGQVGTPGSLAYADTAEEAFEKYKKKLEMKGHTVIDAHEVSKVQCNLCNYSWIAVRPEGLERLECPNCNNMVQFENR